MAEHELRELIADIKTQPAKDLALSLIASGKSYEYLLEELLAGLKVVGERYEKGQYFIADLVVSGMVVKEIFDTIKYSDIHATEKQFNGKVIIGTAYEDIHDIGKNLVKDVLSVYGFEIIDLGVDVSNERFIQTVIVEKPDILAISCVMAGSLKYTRELIRILGQKKLTWNMKIIIGGGGAYEQSFKEDLVNVRITKNLFEGINFCMESGAPVN